MNAVPPNLPPDSDDELRPDARLRSALLHAPDGASRPSPALRSAVLQAARASLPPRPAWWQRLLGIEPGQSGTPRLWTAVAGVGAFGLALNLVWHLSKAPAPTEFDKVATVSEAKRAAAPEPPAPPLGEKVPEAPAPAATPREESAAKSAPRLERQPMGAAQAPARRDAAPAPATRPPSITSTTTDAPAAAAPPAPAAPVVAAVPPAADADDKALAREERANVGRMADAGAADGRASADMRARGGAPAPAAVAPTGVAAAPFPARPGADSARSETAPLAAVAAKPEAPGRAKQAEASMAAAPSSAAWPPSLAKFSNALNGATDWPPGWQLQGPAEVASPRRAWWQAMLAGTAGRWQNWHQALPASVASATTWRLHGPDGAGFSITLADGHAWLQTDGAVWRAPWTVAPPR
ncbi:MAG TPA: hypothetical protein VFY73_01490 [Ideonella sp.]|uniref:hypothetical protein n=1 Tax=Ideonella sp. TaxID=1929293 RepID=UPI002E30C3B8|nr:hypothetical protein [Ideonella sp.]HEX5682681.1 hypothetical protein [Ideonella sp.]